jgi:hypothetical protein
MSPDEAPTAGAVMRLQDELLASPGWPPAQAAAVAPGHGLVVCIAANHRFNALLWAEEDLARRTQVADAEIVANKRAIDRYNQARNDAIEHIDELLLAALGLLAPDPATGQLRAVPRKAAARQNSETAGSMCDRLSILALKVRAMRAQSLRTDVDESHRAASLERLARLEEQRGDLAGCLDALLRETRAGTAWFKVYRQFKMYNDARFNPALVAEARQTSPRT